MAERYFLVSACLLTRWRHADLEGSPGRCLLYIIYRSSVRHGQCHERRKTGNYHTTLLPRNNSLLLTGENACRSSSSVGEVVVMVPPSEGSPLKTKSHRWWGERGMAAGQLFIINNCVALNYRWVRSVSTMKSTRDITSSMM